MHTYCSVFIGENYCESKLQRGGQCLRVCLCLAASIELRVKVDRTNLAAVSPIRDCIWAKFGQ